MSEPPGHPDIPGTLGIIGCGGHATVVYDALRNSSLASSTVVFVDDYATDPCAIDPTAPLYTTEAFLNLVPCSFVVAVGDNATRQRLFELLRQRHEPVTVVHGSVLLGAGAVLGAGSVCLPGVIVNAQATLGANVILNTGSIVEHHCTVGDHVHIAPGAVLCGAVTVGAGALIGANATCLPCVSVGEGAVVGAGTVVTRDVPPGAVITNGWIKTP